MKIGDKVRVLSIPTGLSDDNELKTRSLFEKCVGKSFVITEIENIEGLGVPMLRLDVGEVVGAEPWKHTIWIEPAHVELLNT